MPVCDLTIKPVVAEEEINRAITPFAQSARMRTSKSSGSVSLRVRNLEEAILVKTQLDGKPIGGTRVSIDYDREHAPQ